MKGPSKEWVESRHVRDREYSQGLAALAGAKGALPSFVAGGPHHGLPIRETKHEHLSTRVITGEQKPDSSDEGK